MLFFRASAVAVVFLLATLASFGQQVATPDNAVYAAAIKGDMSRNASSIVVISDLLSNQENAQLAVEDILAQDIRNLLAYYPGLNIAAIDAPTLEAVKNYNTSASTVGNIRHDLALPTSVILITKLQFSKFRKRNPDKGWRALYKKYPGTDGVFEFSQVGYSSDKTRAVVYRAVRRNGFNGEGALLLMVNIGTGWVINQHNNLWSN